MIAKVKDLAQLPAWPRCLSRDQAAAYVGVSPGTFNKEVASGIWPAGEQRGARVLWDRVLLDIAQDKRSGIERTIGNATIAEADPW